MLRSFVAAVAVLWATAAWGGDTVVIWPPDSWVRPLPAPAVPASDDGKPIRNLITDVQVDLDDKGEQVYNRTAIRIQNSAALGAANLNLNWNPQIQTLVVHYFHILRRGEVIDVLRDQKFTVLRRETNLERATLNGVLTASLQPEGVQVGDILDVAYTLATRDPVMRGHAETFVRLFPNVTIDQMEMRAIWGPDKTVRWRETEGLAPAVVTHAANQTELVIRETNGVRPEPPKGAPPRYNYLSVLETSDFQHWSEVSALLSPLYDKAAALSASSPLKAEAARIRAASSDAPVQATAALRLVEDDIRYVFLGMNLGGYVPADADLTWSRRFGDCKGKTVVLLALLHELGIEAEPAIVSSELGDGMDERVPNLELFDHVLVRARIAGKVYWLDGTRTGDHSIEGAVAPQLVWALPLEAKDADLVRIEAAPPAKPMMETTIHADASAGLDAVTPVHIETVLRGDLATLIRLGLATKAGADRDKLLRDYWQGVYPPMDIKAVEAVSDDATGDVRLVADGAEPLTWEMNPAFRRRQLQLTDTRLAATPDYKRDPGPAADAPFAVPFPFYVTLMETMMLPQGGHGFSVVDDPVDQTVAGVEYKRSSRIEGAVFTETSSARAIATEFPAADARAATAALNEMALPGYLRAPAGYTVSDQELALRLSRTPTLASEFADRAEARVERHDFAGALADYDAALKLRPDDAALLNSRCFTRGIANTALDEAMADCNAALADQPRDPAFLDSRGFIYFRLGNLERAIDDLDAALAVAPNQANSLYVRGVIERRIGNARQSAADIAAAEALDAAIAATYAGYGVRP